MNSRRRKFIFVASEGILIFAAIYLAFLMFGGRAGGPPNVIVHFWPNILLITLIIQFSLYFRDLYAFRLKENPIDLASRLVESIGISLILLATVCFFWPELILRERLLFAGLVMMVVLLITWRLLYVLATRKKILTDRAIILGGGNLAGDIWDEIKTGWGGGCNLRGIVVSEKAQIPPGRFGNTSVFNGFGTICDLAEAEKVSSIIVALDEKRNIFPYRELLDCKLRGINIIDGESFYERLAGKILVEKINPSWLIFSEGFARSTLSKAAKRSLDLLVSTILLILSTPFFLLTAAAVKLDSRGPVFFSQERVGKHGRPFMLHKFRSMCENAEKESGPVWAGENDPRITRVGRIIRKVRLDELPQLWNVFNGEMTFVGPRPERQHFVQELKNKIPYYNERFSVKPGVTGWAQIKYGYGATEDDALEKLKYDLYYIKHMTVVMDLLIIFHTVKTVLLARGSR